MTNMTKILFSYCDKVEKNKLVTVLKLFYKHCKMWDFLCGIPQLVKNVSNFFSTPTRKLVDIVDFLSFMWNISLCVIHLSVTQTEPEVTE